MAVYNNSISVLNMPAPLTITMTGQSGFSFVTTSNTGGNQGITTVNNWGTIRNLSNMFANKSSSAPFFTSSGCSSLRSIPPNISPTSATDIFQNCVDLDIDLTGFDLSSLTNPDLGFFVSKLSTANYNKILYYWDTNKNLYASNINVRMGSSIADTSSGGRNGILSKFNLLVRGWTIIDGSGA
jgi:hypothetical protein